MDHKPPITKLPPMEPLNDHFESLPKGFVTGESTLDGMFISGLCTGFNMQQSLYRLQRGLEKMHECSIPVIYIDLEGEVTDETIDKVLTLYKETHTSDKE